MLLALALCVASVSFAEHILADNDFVSRFQEVPVGNSQSLLVDLNAIPNHDLLDRLAKSADVNTYLLYTREKADTGESILTDDLVSIEASNFNPKVPTVFVIPGWQSSPYEKTAVLIKNALLESSDVNVIVVDWRRISNLDYVTAVAGVPRVGKDVSHLLTYLNTTMGVPLTEMHLVGHSLGAHVAGNAGRQTGGKVARITGLDPAGPLWYVNPNRLKPKDAIYVEAIHTNALLLGNDEELADTDFFVNGGIHQPGCIIPSCNHFRACELFAASLSYTLVGRRCSGYLQMHLNLCKGDRLPMGNNDLNKTGKGVYRLNTSGTYPYTLKK